MRISPVIITAKPAVRHGELASRKRARPKTVVATKNPKSMIMNLVFLLRGAGLSDELEFFGTTSL